MNFAPSAHSPVGEAEFSLDSSERFSHCEMLRLDEVGKVGFIDKFNHKLSPCIVESICIVEYKGMVYNLEVEEDNSYVASGIVAHNCRTAIVTLAEGQDAPDGTRAAVGGQDDGAEAFERKQNRTNKKFKYRGKKDQDVFKVGQIPAGTNIDTWLRSQPDWYIESTLGPTKAKLFREGGMKLSKFTDATQRPLTIPELRELDAAAFKRAGL